MNAEKKRGGRRTTTIKVAGKDIEVPNRGVVRWRFVKDEQKGVPSAWVHMHPENPESLPEAGPVPLWATTRTPPSAETNRWKGRATKDTAQREEESERAREGNTHMYTGKHTHTYTYAHTHHSVERTGAPEERDGEERKTLGQRANTHTCAQT